MRKMRKTSRLVQFALCLEAPPESDLETGKLYRVLPDHGAAELGCLRVIDESGEDYLYPATRFVVVEVPQQARRRLLKALRNQAAVP